MVDVVQLAEHQIVVLVVVGSSPIIHPRKNSLIMRFVGRMIKFFSIYWLIFMLVSKKFWRCLSIGIGYFIRKIPLFCRRFQPCIYLLIPHSIQ